MGSFPVRHTGQVTSTSDPLGQVRQNIGEKFCLDRAHMRDDEIGNMEFVWLDREAGKGGPDGKDKKQVLRSIRSMNRYFETAEAIKRYTDEINTEWFTERFGFAGVARHENDSDREAGNDAYQLVIIGFQATVWDIFQAYNYDGKNSAGPDIGDTCNFVLRKVPYINPLSTLEPNLPQQWKWQLSVTYSKDNDFGKICQVYNHRTGVTGRTFRVFKVTHVYGCPENPGAARQCARNYLFNQSEPRHENLMKLRRIEGFVCFC